MKDMGMPAGHVVKLKKCIRKLTGRETASAAVGAGSVALVSSGRPQRPPQGFGKPTQPSTSQMTAVQLSWVQLQQVGTDVAGGLFYKKFFQQQPDAKRLFPMSVRMRYRDWASETEEDENDLDNSPALRKLWAKVIDAVGSAVAGMHEINKLVPMLTQLGMRHVGYGLKPEYVQLAGKILIDVLKEGLGDNCTKEVENAWVMVFGFMSATMLGGFRAMQEEIRMKEKMLSLSRTMSDTLSQHSGGTGSIITQDEELRAAQEAAEEEEKLRREAEEEEEMLRREAEDTIAPLKNLPSLLENLSLYGVEESNDKLQWDAARGFC
jgi:hemoglobin-like flavoprotein